MATKSFLKSISLHGRKQCDSFVRALEDSRDIPSKTVIVSKSVQDMTPEQIQKIFGEKKDDGVLAGQPS